MIIGFNISNLSQMRYFGPIIELIRDEPDFEIILCVFRYGAKYQRLTTDKNYNKFKEITSTIVPDAKIILMKDSNSKYDRKGSKVKCDVLFTSEISSLEYFKFNKHIALQHGSDYIPLGKRATPKTVYIVYNKAYGIDVQKRHNVNYLIPPIPTSCSNIQRQIDFARSQVNTNKKIAYIFYPLKGKNRLVRSVIKYLKKKDFFVIVKQRRKHQEIPRNTGADITTYDEIWYPSESIFYPLISDIVIGFGTTAYFDLGEVGMIFVDNAIIKEVQKDGIFLKPELENYFYFEKNFYKNTIKIIDQFAGTQKIKKVDKNIVREFYLNLIYD